MKRIFALIFVCSVVLAACGDGGEIFDKQKEDLNLSQDKIENAVQAPLISPNVIAAIRTCGKGFILCNKPFIDAMKKFGPDVLLITPTDNDKKVINTTPPLLGAPMVNQLMLISGGKAYFKVGTWQHPILVSEASNDDTGGEHDSSGSEFA